VAQPPAATQICPCCGCEAPAGTYCIRCGSLLSRRFRRYGANPSERAGLPYLVSTLFPALPRAEMGAFRIVLAVGSVLTLGLAGAGLFPLALTSAALLVPILSALYLWEVDVYEDQPWRVIGLTLGLGVLAGVGLGLLSEVVGVSTGDADEDLLFSGVLLPVAALVLALGGPIALLLPRARFNDLLDGATFGAVSAAAVGAAIVLTRGASLLPGGLRPDGDSAEWILRLAGLAVGAPVLAMCVSAGAAASLWVRYRAPIADRGALGPLARPAVAIPLAAALMVVSACTQILLPGGLWLAVLAALDVIALLWLRNVIHEGLRQQADERTEGPPETCVDCGVATPMHSYCGNCGMARAALPKAGRARHGPLAWDSRRPARPSPSRRRWRRPACARRRAAARLPRPRSSSRRRRSRARSSAGRGSMTRSSSSFRTAGRTDMTSWPGRRPAPAWPCASGCRRATAWTTP
jgi:hypothetical protein